MAGHHRRAAVLCGIGTWLPPRVVTNADLARQLDTSDEWIRTRTGIRERRVIDRGMSTSVLAVEAGARALKSSGSSEVDLVVVATTTPDHPCPSTAPEVAHRLGLTGVAAFDLNAVCAGFVYALATAAGHIAAGSAERVLVIGADTFTTVLNPLDRTTLAIFGDGAGAVVLRAGTPDEPGALGPFDLGADGSNADLLIVPAGGSEQRGSGEPLDPADVHFRMDGQPVFRNAVTRMSESAVKVLDRAGWRVEDVDRFACHQANARIISAVARDLAVPQERFVLNVDRVGNTVAASIPLVLADAAAAGDIEPGHRVLVTSFGAGLGWGSTVLTWPELDLG
ncbi:3-oxoacyl-[acyl-carrier-protein] synthase-3 [Lentzea fradiae]|uniref:Beta-ketoacyl-[acyl-carrier-protein] synthase III n=1 Tax=Lentzea fradiae TaxID=200378 RepID=A0A1G8CN59_9PSEU|nr:beta-ketoacyl-ACP synthase III [Lentzea fradiae]SDH46739.1 3-oxoacyl-[acyl-carrier-protein] synthase-3 [Lentzea fradiae]